MSPYTFEQYNSDSLSLTICNISARQLFCYLSMLDQGGESSSQHPGVILQKWKADRRNKPSFMPRNSPSWYLPQFRNPKFPSQYLSSLSECNPMHANLRVSTTEHSGLCSWLNIGLSCTAGPRAGVDLNLDSRSTKCWRGLNSCISFNMVFIQASNNNLADKCPAPFIYANKQHGDKQNHLVNRPLTSS